MKRLHAWFDAVPGTIMEEHETCSPAGSERHVDAFSMMVLVRYNADIEWAIARSTGRPDTLDLVQRELDAVVGQGGLVTDMRLTPTHSPPSHNQRLFNLDPPSHVFFFLSCMATFGMQTLVTWFFYFYLFT